MKKKENATTSGKSHDGAGSETSLAALRRKAEEKLHQRLGRLDELSRQDIEELVHDLGTLQIELEMQNEELRRAQEELEISRRSYVDLYDFSPAGYFSVDPQCAILSVNLTAAAMLAVARNELIGKPFILFVLKEDRDIFYLHINKLKREGDRHACELRLMRGDGSLFHVQLESAAIRAENSNVVDIRTSVSDISERKQAELALAASEGRFRRMAETSADIIFQIDPAGGILYASPAIRSLGYTPDQVTGKPFAKFIPPDELPRAMEALRRLNDGKSISLFEIKVLKGDATIADCEVNATPIVRDGIVVGMQGMARDISERMRMEAALKSTMARFELLAGTAGELLRATEPREVVKSVCHQAMEHLRCDVCYNFLAVEGGGRFLLNVCTGISEDEARAIDPLLTNPAFSGSAACDSRHIVAERIGTVPDEGTGPPRACGIRAYVCYPLTDPGGEVVGTLFFGTRSRETFSKDDLALMQAVADQVAVAITRLRYEQTLKLRNKELAEANRELETFSNTVSHDLRTPLRSIEGFTTAIVEDYGAALEKGAKEHLNKVITASRRMGQLIDAMLNLARLTRRELKESTVNLSSMAEVAAYELEKMNPDRRVECTIAKKMKVRGDFNLLRIVVENLLDNAWKFTARTDKARIDFGTLQMEDAEAGMKTVYFVRDNGAGFDPYYTDKLFSPFARLHSEAEFPGLGIGLATVKKIIARHGGKIWAKGEPDRGATFYFTLG